MQKLFLVAGAVVAGVTASVSWSAPSSDRFLIFPLANTRCADPGCTRKFTEGAYTPGGINTILDHSLDDRSPKMRQYGKNGVLAAFNGESVRGTSQNGDASCIGGQVLLRTGSANLPMTNPRACNGSGVTSWTHRDAKYSSYDGHPGYDYYAASGTPVYASAAGSVLNRSGYRCINTNLPGGSCEDWGFLAIDHGNGIITQYGHLSRYCVSKGAGVNRGQLIGYSGSKAAPGYSVAPHLHFEVLYKDGTNFLVVDPYGWTGARGRDPLYSSSRFSPRNMWSTQGTPEVKNPSC